MLLKWWPVKFIKRSCDNRGGAAIEFGLISPVFFVAIIGIFEVGAMMLIQASLEMAVLQVSRYGRTGSSVAGQTSAEVAASLASTYSYGFVNPSLMQLTVVPYSSFSAIPPLSQVQVTGTQDFGLSKQPVLYVLSYDWNFLTPFVGQLLSSTGSITLKAVAVIQNEPY
ncbi:MAG: pilus assembly protein [Proteobacteria bacterium]|nr:pilus assembly protein [Pseudomonadota bacterium]